MFHKNYPLDPAISRGKRFPASIRTKIHLGLAFLSSLVIELKKCKLLQRLASNITQDDKTRSLTFFSIMKSDEKAEFQFGNICFLSSEKIFYLLLSSFPSSEKIFYWVISNSYLSSENIFYF